MVVGAFAIRRNGWLQDVNDRAWSLTFVLLYGSLGRYQEYVVSIYNRWLCCRKLARRRRQ